MRTKKLFVLLWQLYMAVESRLWRLLAPPFMRHYTPSERSLVRASLTKGSCALKMMAAGQVLFGPMLFAAAVLFWVLAAQLATARR